jgi:hypothetical protein
MLRQYVHNDRAAAKCGLQATFTEVLVVARSCSLNDNMRSIQSSLICAFIRHSQPEHVYMIAEIEAVVKILPHSREKSAVGFRISSKA